MQNYLYGDEFDLYENESTGVIHTFSYSVDFGSKIRFNAEFQ